jgi:putative ABC transport system ATP-binding protein
MSSRRPELLIEARGLTRVHRQGLREVHTLRGVDLEVAAGAFLTIMGPSGSGKSTLLHLLGGLDTPTTGTVLFRGRNLQTLGDRARSVLRRREIGFVFQLFNLLPTMTAAENAALPLLLAGEGRRRALDKADAALQRLGLSDRSGHFPDELSGGEMQRVAIARALVTEPALVLCDEPTGSLDSASGCVVLDLLRSLPEPGRRSVVMVTHDARAAAQGDRTVTMRDGRIEADDTLREPHVLIA